MVIGIEEIFSFCQMVIRKMGLVEIQLYHPSQGMTYEDFQRLYGGKDRDKTSFQDEVISCIADVLAVYGQGLAKEIFIAYIEDSERVDSIAFENSDYLAFKREIPKFLYLTYGSFHSQRSQLQPQSVQYVKGQIFDIIHNDKEVTFLLRTADLQSEFKAKTKEELIQLLTGIDMHVPSNKTFEYLKDDFTLQMLYGRDVYFCTYQNILGQKSVFPRFFSSEEQAKDRFRRVFLLREEGLLSDCAIHKENRECFNSLLSEDVSAHKKRTLGGLLEVYSYEYMAIVVFSANQNKVGRIYGWFDDRGMHWKSDLSDMEMRTEMIRVLKNLDAEIGCQPQKPSRRNRRRR
jgi:hypothetical protein